MSEINTETHTFVRSSALDILSKFPQTETIMDMGNKHTRLNAVEEDAQVQGDECLDSGPTSSKYAHESAQIEVKSWSATGDIKKKHKKKGNKKVKDKSIPSERDNLEQGDNIKDNAKKAKKKIRKEKAHSAQSLKWFKPLKVFRGKPTVTETTHEDIKDKKQKRPLQKSQSFDENSLPRSSQLNRMNSFRKLFKRQRDSAALGETKPINNQKCMEISNPILKSDFRSKNLVDREVFLRERAYQIDKTKVKQEKKENEASSNINTNNNTKKNSALFDNSDESEMKSEVTINGYVKTQETPECNENPVAPVRHKHLQKKQRLSMLGPEELQQDDLAVDDKEENTDDNDENSCMVNNKEHDELQIDIDQDNEHKISYLSTEIKDKEDFEYNEAEIADKNIDENTKQDIIDDSEQQVNKPIVNDEIKEVKVDNDENLNHVIMESEPGHSSVITDTSSTNLDEKTSSPIEEVISPVVPDESHERIRHEFSTPQSPESENEDVFIDCINDEKISFDSATVLVDQPQVKTKKTGQVEDTSMPSGRSISDVNSRESQRAISKAIQKKPASFSGGTY